MFMFTVTVGGGGGVLVFSKLGWVGWLLVFKFPVTGGGGGG